MLAYGSLTVAVIHINRHHNGAGIDFIGFLHIFELSFRFQLSHRNKRKVHQADEFIASARKKLFPGFYIIFVGSLQNGGIITLFKLYVLQFRGKSGMTAVIGPVGIENLDFGYRRVSFLFRAEMFTDKIEITISHRQAEAVIKRFKILIAHRGESLKNSHIRRIRENAYQCLGLSQIGFFRIHRVNAVCFNLGKFLIRNITGNHIGNRRLNDGIFILF